MKNVILKLTFLSTIIFFGKNSCAVAKSHDLTQPAENFALSIFERPGHKEFIILAWICCNKNILSQEMLKYTILFCAAKPDQLRTETLRHLKGYKKITEPFVYRVATADDLETIFKLIHQKYLQVQ